MQLGDEIEGAEREHARVSTEGTCTRGHRRGSRCSSSSSTTQLQALEQQNLQGEGEEGSAEQEQAQEQGSNSLFLHHKVCLLAVSSLSSEWVCICVISILTLSLV